MEPSPDDAKDRVRVRDPCKTGTGIPYDTDEPLDNFK